jgi:hypothetical protein
VFLPICQAAGTQGNIKIVSDGAHGAIIVWLDRRPGAVGVVDLYAQRVDSSGTVRWTSDGVVVSNAAGQQGTGLALSIVPDGSGGAIVVWADSRNAATNGWDIYTQRLDANGVTQWLPATGVVVCDAIGDQGVFSSVPTQLAAAPDGSGGVLASWIDRRDEFQPYPNNKIHVYAQRISSTGSAAWSTNGVLVTDAPYLGSSLGGIVSDGNGGALVYQGLGDVTGNGDTSSVAVRHLGPTGIGLGTATLVSKPPSSGTSADPEAFASDGHGGLLAAWVNIFATPPQLLAGRVDNTGTVRWTGVSVCPGCESVSNARYRVVPDGSGGAIVGFTDFRASRYDLLAQHVDALGNVLWGGGGVLVNTLQQQDAFLDAAVEDGAGGAILTWRDNDGTNFAQYAQRLSGLGSPLWAAGGEVAHVYENAAAAVPVVVNDGLQRGIVAWAEQRVGHASIDVYAARFPWIGTTVAVSGPVVATAALGLPMPNPAFGRMRIPVNLGAMGAGRTAELSFHDILGRRVRVWRLPLDAGDAIEWDGSDDLGRRLPAGIYTAELTVSGMRIGPTRRVVWLSR